ncbi:MAG: hypothetical protein NTU64_14015, partial [Hyphomicrobiales bacterium]|nr:hypothetical protein [Hyphomicrobiales bacterium]
AIPGEVVAARARAVYASKHGPAYTGSIGKPTRAGAKKPVAIPEAVPGEDGEFDDDDEVTGSIGAPAQTGWPRLAPQAIEPRYRPDNASNY